VKINKNSWHARLALHYPPVPSYAKPGDLCTYVRAVLRGVLFAAGIASAVAVLLAFGLVLPVVRLFTGFSWVPPHEDGSFSFVVFALLHMLVFSAICTYISRKISDWKYERRQKRIKELESDPEYWNKLGKEIINKQPGLFSMWWQSVKEKTCFLVEYTK
jgi:Zn-dependent protease with chaperone function